MQQAIFKNTAGGIEIRYLFFGYASSSTPHPRQPVGGSEFRTSVAWSLQACSPYDILRQA